MGWVRQWLRELKEGGGVGAENVRSEYVRGEGVSRGVRECERECVRKGGLEDVRGP